MEDRIAFQKDLIHPSVFLAEGVVIRGDVTIGEQSSVWFNAVLRGDCEAIHVGRRSNVQDACVLHADPGFPCRLGDNVTLGHGAIVHGAQVADNVMIGMRAVVMNGAKIGPGSIVGVGAVVTEGSEIPPGSLVVGLPAKVKRELTEKEVNYIRRAAEHDVEQAQRYEKGDKSN